MGSRLSPLQFILTLENSLDSISTLSPRQIIRENSHTIEKIRGNNLSNLEKLKAWSSLHQNQLLARLKRFEVILLILTISSATLIGILSSQAIFFYTGTSPINLFAPLIVFALIPALLLLITLSFLCLPQNLSTRFTLSELNPVQILKLFYSDYPLERTQRVQGIYKWYIASTSQLFAMIVFLSALLTYLYLLSFSDLAFGWSTTLSISSKELFEIIRPLAAPWQVIWPAAVPTQDLVENTRFFRLQSEADSLSPELFGQWWQFIAALIFFYAFLPRVLTLIFSEIALRREANHLALKLPGSSQLIWLLDERNPVFDSDLDSHEILSESSMANIESIERDPSAKTSFKQYPLKKECLVLTWGFSIDRQELPLVFSGEINLDSAPLEEIGPADLSDEFSARERLLKYRQKLIFVLVKSWEIPKLEIFDFFKSLASESKEIEFVFLPIHRESPSQIFEGSTLDLKVWHQSVLKQNHPQLIYAVK